MQRIFKFLVTDIRTNNSGEITIEASSVVEAMNIIWSNYHPLRYRVEQIRN